MNTEQERSAFEMWYMREFEVYPRRSESGGFKSQYVNAMFKSWKAGRAALQSQDREDAEVTAYALPSGVSIERTMQRNGAYLWAVRDGLKKCLSKSGNWDYEPFPSSRTEEWLDQHRFSSAVEAIDHARRAEGEGE